jgi:hypothetical protein
MGVSAPHDRPPIRELAFSLDPGAGRSALSAAW